MRAALGFAGVHVLFALPGMALLFALGFVSRPRHLPAAIGPAYLCGLAAVMPVLILMLVVGLPARLPHVVAMAAAVTAALVAVGIARRRREARGPEDPPPEPGSSVERWLTRVGIAVLVLFFAVSARAFANLPTVNDGWTMWSYKGLALFHFGELQVDTFGRMDAGPWHPEYPLLQPLLESIFFRAMGGPHLQEMHLVLWLVFGAFVWTVAYLLRARGIGLLLSLAPVGALALTAGSHKAIALGYADTTVACFSAAGVLAIGLWVDSGRTRFALLGGVLLAGAANVKTEGLVVAAIVLAAAAAALALARLPRWRVLAVSGGIAGLGAAPWLAWCAAHGLENRDTEGIDAALDWSFLADRLDRLSRANGEILEQLANQGLWTWIAPAFLALAAVCLVTGAARRQASFYLATATLVTFALLWAYWTGRIEIGHYLLHSSERVVGAVVFVCAGGLAHLAGILLPKARRDE
jgi:hypothetical protein